jgi:hypothetical protein
LENAVRKEKDKQNLTLGNNLVSLIVTVPSYLAVRFVLLVKRKKKFIKMQL